MKQFILKHKLLLIIAGLLLSLVVAYYVIFVYNSDEAIDTSSQGGSGTPKVKPVIKNPSATLQFPVEPGDVGKQVKQLQKYLNAKYNAGLTPDGVWGTKTTKALDKANIAIEDRPGFEYKILTEALYNKLNLKNY